jgi:hypothetical protein
MSTYADISTRGQALPPMGHPGHARPEPTVTVTRGISDEVGQPPLVAAGGAPYAPPYRSVGTSWGASLGRHRTRAHRRTRVGRPHRAGDLARRAPDTVTSAPPPPGTTAPGQIRVADPWRRRPPGRPDRHRTGCIRPGRDSARPDRTGRERVIAARPGGTHGGTGVRQNLTGRPGWSAARVATHPRPPHTDRSVVRPRKGKTSDRP